MVWTDLAAPDATRLRPDGQKANPAAPFGVMHPRALAQAHQDPAS
jgi:hypothetical protein